MKFINNMSSINVLIEAAAFIEKREREAEHGYASTVRIPDDLRNGSKRPKNKKSQGNRTSHNELEKNRRAHLRTCLEFLKEIVPLGTETTRHTTLGLLTKAKRFIKTLEEKHRKHEMHKSHLSAEYRRLRRKVEQLSFECYGTTASVPSMSKRRSVSECSSSTISSSHSSASFSSLSFSAASSPISETDEVDVIGYTSNQTSDSDDHSSVQSTSTDSGVAMEASILSLSEEMDVL